MVGTRCRVQYHLIRHTCRSQPVDNLALVVGSNNQQIFYSSWYIVRNRHCTGTCVLASY